MYRFYVLDAIWYASIHMQYERAHFDVLHFQTGVTRFIQCMCINNIAWTYLYLYIYRYIINRKMKTKRARPQNSLLIQKFYDQKVNISTAQQFVVSFFSLIYVMVAIDLSMIPSNLLCICSKLYSAQPTTHRTLYAPSSSLPPIYIALSIRSVYEK